MQKSFNLLKGLAVVSCIGLLLFSFWGCFDDPVDADSVTISIVSFDSLTVNAIKQIEGEVEASPAVDESAFEFSISNNAAQHFDITMNDIEPMEKIDLNTDLGLKIKPLNTVPSGSYTLTIEVTAGSYTGSKPVTFGINNQTVTPITTKNFTLGASASTNGSSLDVDIGAVYKTADLRSNATLQATVDVYFAVTASSESKLGSPSWANTNGWGPESGGSWLSAPATEFIKVTTDFSAIASQEDIDALWSGTGASNLVVAANDVVLVKTTVGTYGAIQVVSASTSTSGDAVLNVKIKQ